MKNKNLVFSIAFIFVLFRPEASFGGQAEPRNIRRFAMVVGSNDGGRRHEKLRYAVSDARSILNVFRELGGVAEEDGRLLSAPTAHVFFLEIDKLRETIRKARGPAGRIEVFFYYSGHADDEGLYMGDEKIPFPTIKEAIENLEAEVRIIILDSCASGAYTRLKGGKKRRLFLSDSAYNMKGNAVLTSSSSDEASQESDLIQGSFFTHYLVSGMRGAADATQDGRVTLSEAYQFAFNETLAQTARASAGPQHPNYTIEMSGTGDVILTDIRHGTAMLVLAEDIGGRIFIHNRADKLVAEAEKRLGHRLEIGLEDGDYKIINIPKEGEVREARLVLAGDGPRLLSAADFEKTSLLYTTPRGDRQERQTRSVLLERAKPKLYVELAGRSGQWVGRTSVLLGVGAGVTFGQKLTIGLADVGGILGSVEWLNPSRNWKDNPLCYVGIFFAWNFFPERTIHLRANILAGAGVDMLGLDSKPCFIIEPGIDLIVNLSSMFRLTAGLRRPFTDIGGSLERLCMNIGLQIGK